MKSIKLIFIFAILFSTIDSNSQILLEEATSLSNITQKEKEIVAKDGYIIRPECIYYKKYPLMPKEYDDDTKVRKYLKCKLKITHNGIGYEILAIGNATRYHYDGSVETEEIFDSLGYRISTVAYDQERHGHYLNI